MTSSICVLHHLARSGGTLISKCLGSMDPIILLSEIHPFASGKPHNPIIQAIVYHKLFDDADIQALMARGQIDWLSGIELIAERVRLRGKQLLIRDWSHLDFTGIPWIPKPSYRLTCAQLLAERFDVHQMTTVRHPIDQWSSLQRLALIRGKLDIPTFLKGYRAFAEQAAALGFVRFEDFTHDPPRYAREICDQLQLSYDGSFIERWHQYTKITGDVELLDTGRATRSGVIEPLERRNPSPELAAAFAACPDYLPAIRLLGYPA